MHVLRFLFFHLILDPKGSESLKKNEPNNNQENNLYKNCIKYLLYCD